MKKQLRMPQDCHSAGVSTWADADRAKAKAKIFLGQKTRNSNRIYAPANTPCSKDLHLAGYSWCTSVQL